MPDINTGHLYMRDLIPEEKVHARYATLNFDGQLATSSQNTTGLFNTAAEASKHKKYLETTGITDVWVENVSVMGDIIKVPTNGNLTLPDDQVCRSLAKMVLQCAYKTLCKSPQTGGCCTFYTPTQWKERGEKHCLNADLIICHDGGDFSYMCSYTKGDYRLLNRFTKHLKDAGYYSEQGTNWYSGLYKIEA